uniref:ATP-grasp domain-containing protein n=1 Tax=Romanomermis culicivorax TaxID=13658 RepID=A0A915J6J1_ROMCU
MPRLVEENEHDRILINNLDNNSMINGVRNDNSDKAQKIKIALLWSSYDRSDSVFKGNDPAPTGILECNPDPEKYEFHLEGIDKHTAISTIQKFIEAKKYDLYINLCDGAEYHDTAGVEVAEFFWRQNSIVPFVSPTVHFYLFSKFKIKFVAQSCGITTPLYFFIYKMEDFDNCLKKSKCKNLKFPMLVKHHNGAGSEGLYKNCLVYCSEDLEDRIRDIVKNHGGALVEEFVDESKLVVFYGHVDFEVDITRKDITRKIDNNKCMTKGDVLKEKLYTYTMGSGRREFTVLVQENPENSDQPIVYHPFECLLQDTDSFKDFGRKFIDFESLEWRVVDEEHLAMKLRNMTKRMFVACGANMYA